jgi:capsid protein
LPLPAADAQGKAKWWAVTFTSQRLLTIDRGKESRARLEELNAGVGCLADWEDFDGRDWKDRGKQRIREHAFLKAECAAEGLEYQEVFPPRPGSAPAATAESDKSDSSDSSDDDEETPPTT